MTLLTDNRSAASNIIFPKKGQEVKVIRWDKDYALCSCEYKGVEHRFWILKTKLK